MEYVPMKMLILGLIFICAPAFADVTITVKKVDGSTYWVDRFATKADADAWLAEEKTRPYWKSTYTIAYSGSDVVHNTVPVIDPTKVANRAARLAQLQTALSDWANLTAAQQKAVIKAVAEHILDL